MNYIEFLNKLARISKKENISFKIEIDKDNELFYKSMFKIKAYDKQTSRSAFFYNLKDLESINSTAITEISKKEEIESAKFNLRQVGFSDEEIEKIINSKINI